MDIALIVAMAENGVIGRNNQLPWHLPEDLRYFRKVTMGKPIIMGRKTYESIGKPLPGRTNIVISKHKDLALPEGVYLAGSIKAALQIAEDVALASGATEVMVIGGEQIYALFMPKATRLYLTKVHAEIAGDAWFSAYDKQDWQLVAEETFMATGNNPYDYSFCQLIRK